MAEHSTPEERTEMPSERRMQQLRGEGQIFMSYEIVQVLTLTAGFYLFSFSASWLFSNLKILTIRSFLAIQSQDPLSPQTLTTGALLVLWTLIPSMLVMVIGVSATATLGVMLQTKWNIRNQWIKFRWNFFNPIGGLRRIFSAQGFVNTGKAILKLSIILPIAYFALRARAVDMLALMHMNLTSVLAYTGLAMTDLFWKILYILIPLAIFDYFYGRFQWLKMNKMTKDEVKDERKAVEGDEETRRKIVQKGLSRIIQRIRSTVPKADIVVTNPTHIAVALKYERGGSSAPIVVAKGKGFLAERIKEIARESNIPILERKPIARALYASVRVGAEIPAELFRAVAEVYAYLYRIRPGKRPNVAANQGAR